MKNTVNLQKSIEIELETGKRMTGRGFPSGSIMTIITGFYTFKNLLPFFMFSTEDMNFCLFFISSRSYPVLVVDWKLYLNKSRL